MAPALYVDGDRLRRTPQAKSHSVMRHDRPSQMRLTNGGLDVSVRLLAALALVILGACGQFDAEEDASIREEVAQQLKESRCLRAMSDGLRSLAQAELDDPGRLPLEDAQAESARLKVEFEKCAK